MTFQKSIVSIIALIAVVNPAASEDAPKITYPTNVGAYVTITSAVTAEAKDMLTNMRAEARTKLLRGIISNYFPEPKNIPTPGAVIAALPSATDGVSMPIIKIDQAYFGDLMCVPRVDYFPVYSRSNLLSSINDSLQKLYTDSDASAAKQFASKFTATSPSIKPAKEISGPDICADDLNKFQVVYYPVAPQPTKTNPTTTTSSILLATGAIFTTAVVTYKDIIEPSLKLALAIETNAERTEAVKTFFSSESQQSKIIDAVKQLHKSSMERAERLRKIKMGYAFDAWLSVTQTPVDVGQDAQNVCKEYLQKQKIAPTNSDQLFDLRVKRANCIKLVWSKISTSLNEPFTKAGDYDTAADLSMATIVAGPTNATDDPNIEALQRTINALAAGKESVSDFIDQVSAYISLGAAIEKAAHDADNDNIKKAVAKALGG